MKFDVDDKNRCRLVCVKFHLNRCGFAAAVAKCLGGSLFGGHSVSRRSQRTVISKKQNNATKYIHRAAIARCSTAKSVRVFRLKSINLK